MLCTRPEKNQNNEIVKSENVFIVLFSNDFMVYYGLWFAGFRINIIAN